MYNYYSSSLSFFCIASHRIAMRKSLLTICSGRLRKAQGQNDGYCEPDSFIDGSKAIVHSQFHWNDIQTSGNIHSSLPTSVLLRVQKYILYVYPRK